MCNLPKFTIGGSVHIITNNQVGFTTDPRDGRSFPNSSDIVKSFGIPVIRVNTFDPEAVMRASKLAIRYWQKYGKDILLDMIGCRKYGHNEVDEPAFTQPAMYQKIRAMESLPTQYSKKLVEEKIVA